MDKIFMNKEARRKLGYVVIIDDDDISNYLLVRLLRRLNVCEDVKLLKNGKEGLTFISQNILKQPSLPHLIFLDINMPVMNGFEFIENLHKMNIDNDKIKIITISNHMNESSKAQLRALNFKHSLIKPLKAAEITDILI
jgi:CheY-like chemotaxis protein